MSIEIFQIKPRLVFSSGNKIYKFFNISDDCQSEVKSIMSSPMQSHFDRKSKYTMNIVDIIFSDDYYYVMNIVKGENLIYANSDEYYYLAGRWLRSFHSSSYSDIDKSVFLFGDFVAAHLYIDKKNKKITVIDPGANFGNLGQVEEDIARFVVSLFQTRDLNINRLNTKLLKFIDGYGVEKINYDVLNKSVKSRISRNLFKAITLNKGLSRLISAYFWVNMSKIKHFLIKKNLKIILYEH